MQLLEILGKPGEFGEAISWSVEGDAVVIWDAQKLEPVLHKYFDSTRWRSFRCPHP